MASGEIFRIFISWLIPFVSVAAISWFGKCLHNVRTDNVAMKNGLLAIIRSQIVSKCEEYQDRAFTEVDAVKTWCSRHQTHQQHC